MNGSPAGPARRGFLLDLDPDLARGIPEQDRDLARQATPVNLIRVRPGTWALPDSASESGDVVALIVSDGVLSREIALRTHVAVELLCHGNVVLVPTPATDHAALSADITLIALSAGELIVLSRPFLHAAARWPVLLTNLHRRLEAQRQRLALQGLTSHLPRAEDRVLLTLWLMAESCGHVTPDGIVLPLTLSHEVLARLTAARRPTITLALRALEAADYIQRRPGKHLTLTRGAQHRVHELTHTADVAPAVGPNLVLHGRG